MTQSRHCGPRSQLPYFVKSWEDANLGAAQGASSHGITSSYQEFQMIHGHCECGLVSFEADCKISDFSHCHCSQCRRLHGAAYATFAEVESREFRYVSGEEIIKVYASSEDSDRVFCGNCGSNILVYTKSYPDFLYLSMGAVDGNPDHPTAYHQYVGSKAPWHEITDDAAQFDGDPPE